MEPVDSDNTMGLEIEPGRSKSEDVDFDAPVDAFDVEQEETKKETIRDEIKKIEREIDSINNTPNYGDDERLSFLETKKDSLKTSLLKDDMK